MIFTDQLSRKIDLPETPQRIISLVPSQTELLYDLGVRDEVVGITKFCIHPKEWHETKTRIGGTKNIDFEKIKQLEPDLIIGNKEENDQQQIEELYKHFNVWMSDINTLKDSFEMMTRLGAMLGKYHESINLKIEIEFKFNNFNIPNKFSSPKNIAYFIWRNPYMIAGRNTFINDMLTRCGFNNAFSSDASSRYPEVTKEQIMKANPEIIFLSSEPFPFNEEHIMELQAICPDAKVMIVDGEMFSWYGSRLLQAPAYFTKLIQLLM